MLAKINKTISLLEGYGVMMIEKKPNAIVMSYKGHKINVLPSGSIYLDNKKNNIIAFKQFAKESGFKSLLGGN